MLDGVELIGDGRASPTGSGPSRPSRCSASTRRAPPRRPTRCVPSAKAKLSVRLAPGDDPKSAYAAVRAHLEKYVPWGAQVDGDAGERRRRRA